ncbi:MAG: hypothetical protein MI924_12790, partial [Chloroflexales bacterium]|nr:hypothetical protein [Chloroflexales bacterium]
VLEHTHSFRLQWRRRGDTHSPWHGAVIPRLHLFYLGRNIVLGCCYTAIVRARERAPPWRGRRDSAAPILFFGLLLTNVRYHRGRSDTPVGAGASASSYARYAMAGKGVVA